jgi:hypothetical protein
VGGNNLRKGREREAPNMDMGMKGMGVLISIKDLWVENNVFY